MEEYIYYTTPELGWGDKWKPFKIIGIHIQGITKAMSIVRSFDCGTIGLSTKSQMTIYNIEWDNL